MSHIIAVSAQVAPGRIPVYRYRYNTGIPVPVFTQD